MVFVVDVSEVLESRREYTYVQMGRSRNGGEFLYIEEDRMRIRLSAPNYAVPTLGIYREENYHLDEKVVEKVSWRTRYISLGNISWPNEVAFWLDWSSRYVEFKYEFSIVRESINGYISINQTLNCLKDLASLMTTPVSVLL